MTDPLDTLRQEVREAVGRMVVLCSAANKTGKWVRADCDVVIVAELLRLASENMELRGANRRMKFLLDITIAAFGRAALKDENAQLRDVLADRDMDREMAAHANKELAALKARIAGQHSDRSHKYVQSKEHGGCSECGYPEWEPWHRVALVKAEE